MWRRYILGGFMGVTAIGTIGCAAAKMPDSGVTGRVVMTNVCHGAQKPGQDCSVPYAAAKVQLRTAAGLVVGAATAAADGLFTIPAPAGDYEVHIAVLGMYPRCEPVEVKVESGRIAQVEIACDSGMR